MSGRILANRRKLPRREDAELTIITMNRMKAWVPVSAHIWM